MDVPASYPEQAFIERLAGLGVASGCEGSVSRFCPDDTLSREQLAVFLDGLRLPSVDMEGFVDVDEGSRYEDSIKRVWAAGLDDGCAPEGPLWFCPGGVVSRGQAATVLIKAADWRDANGPQADRVGQFGRADDSL